MKRFIIYIMMGIFGAAGAFGQVVRGEKMVGVNVGYASHNESAVAAVSFRYAVSPWVRIAPEVGCVFRHHNEDALFVNLDAQIPFSFGTKNVDLYPLAGLAYNSWSRHHQLSDIRDDAGLEATGAGELDNDVTTRANRIGANLGAGFDLRVTRTLNIGIEAKYTFTKSYTSLYATASISFVF